MNVITSRLLDDTGLVSAAVSTRQGGPGLSGNLSFRVGDTEENVGANRKQFGESMGIPPDRWAIPEQQHGNTVRRADRPGSYPACDGLVTGSAGIGLCVTVADCAPLLIADLERRAIAVLHAGWRGTAAGVAGRGIEALVREYGSRPGDMLAFIGPCAGPCCYAVGEDVAGRFSPEFLRRSGGQIFLDLTAANASQLEAAGIPTGHIEVSGHCTIHEAGLFHSFRRDGKGSGRMMAVMGLKENSASL